VRRGTWIPPDRNQRTNGHDTQAPADEPTFHAFASSWHANRRGEISERTHEYEQWALHYHLLPYFANWPLREIDIEAVDDGVE
jgi:Phage integrase, N-terminal SAM-like domain